VPLWFKKNQQTSTSPAVVRARPAAAWLVPELAGAGGGAVAVAPGVTVADGPTSAASGSADGT